MPLPDEVYDFPIFKDLTKKQRTLLDEEGRLDMAPMGEVFAHQGDYTGKFRVIIEGLVSAYREEPGGETIRLGTYGVRDWFGEMSALSNRPEPATLRADSRCAFVVVDQALFKQLYKGKTKFKELVDQTYRERALSVHLRVAPVFKGLVADQLSALRQQVEMLEFDKGQVIARGGQTADALYLIRSGAVKCVGRDHQGKEKIVGYYMDNSSFGERALTSEAQSWPGNYESMAATAVLKVSREAFVSTFGANSAAMSTIQKAAGYIVAEEEGEASGYYEVDSGDGQKGYSADQLEVMVGKESVKGGEALVINLNRCIRCNACVESCVAVHEDRVPRLSKTGTRISAGFNLASSCYNCDIPECMMACEYGAIRRDVQGLIRFVWDNCTGCQACTTACPYGVISMTPPPPTADAEPRFKRRWFLQTVPFIGKYFAGNTAVETVEATEEPVRAALRGTKVRGKAVKCDLCAGLPFEACVYNCPCSAISRVNPERLFEEDGTVRIS